ncbi:uncharacterized protein N7469_005263 [Penicillium citrinum]|uniref:DUF7600 domain-containing protein n=1 Tax=Penicillium citrinum TaxID=5077 RepID=A0A9W9TP57_PENCI|nr:uncharacterized protein N7469_005263 [Penicillium citrinum]KAJ5233497.1 hypothetical protein N7469_005263 [Penicillium citrinum]
MNDWKTQWLVNENLRDRYMMFEDPNYPLIYSSSPLEIEAPDGSFRWKIIQPYCMVHKREHLQSDDHFHIISLPKSKFGALQCGRCGRQGCFTKTHTIPISYPILKIAVSVLVEDKRTYISGFDLIHGSNILDTQFGYRIPGKQVTLDLHGQNLQGFQVAKRGPAITAIRPLTDTGEDGFYSWVGDPEHGIKYSAYLGLNEDIAAILGDFQRKQNEEARAIRHGHVVVASDPVPDNDKTVYAHARGIFIVRQGHRADAIPIVECMAYLARILLRTYRS